MAPKPSDSTALDPYPCWSGVNLRGVVGLALLATLDPPGVDETPVVVAVVVVVDAEDVDDGVVGVSGEGGVGVKPFLILVAWDGLGLDDALSVLMDRLPAALRKPLEAFGNRRESKLLFLLELIDRRNPKWQREHLSFPKIYPHKLPDASQEFVKREASPSVPLGTCTTSITLPSPALPFRFSTFLHTNENNDTGTSLSSKNEHTPP